MVLQESSEWRVGKVGQLIIDLSGRHGFRRKTRSGREYITEAFNHISHHFLIFMPFSVLVFYLVAP
jgi:hypothetical protein